MLIAYALDGGKGGYGIRRSCREAARLHADRLQGGRRLRPRAGHLRPGAARPRDRISPPRTPTSRSALWLALKPRLAAERMVNVYETLERPMVPVLARMEARGIKVDRQILSRLSGEFAQKLGGLESEIYELAGEELQHRLAQAARRHPLRQVRPAPAARRPRPAPGRPAPTCSTSSPRRQHARRPHPRLAPALQAEIDLHRPPARLHPSRDRPRPHLLRAGLDHHRPAVLVRPQPAEHPGPHRGGPAHPHRLHRRDRA